MKQFDIVIVGAGASGISAGLAAAQKGAKVALLEKGDKFGGAGMFGAQGLFAAESQVQKAAGVNYSVKDAYQEIINYTHHSSNARMTKAIVEKSASTIAWMKENGLDTELVTNTQEVHQDHPRTYHQFIDKFNGFKRIVNNFEKAGGVLMTQTTGKKIIQENGKVTGLEVIKDGQQEVIPTKTVILADGGFAGDKEEVNKYLPFDVQDLYSMGERKATGDGLRMLKEAGGVNNYKRIFENHAASVVTGDKNPWNNGSIMTIATLPLFWIDQEGKRFTNEDVVYDFALWGDTTYNAGGHYYILLDQNLVDYLTKNELNWTGSFERTGALLAHKPMAYKVGPMPNLPEELNRLTNGPVWKADTLEDLSKQINVSQDTLVNTVTDYNELVKKGEDTEFYKDSKFMKFPLEKGPFYAIKANSTTLGTVGGGLVNENFEALTKDKKVIPGVYAVGNDASGMFDSSYPTIEGLSNAFAWNSGRIAGEHAADFVRK
ncbi:FAD-dependent oxidoreductase [Lactobacillus sp. HT06-2]|uniref:FAD-dependent oxidoreductase n=1 Tax=Lactobacillus sp. HT06-2 TaxID=2080222 RepID=UPI000CD97F59|nr:FAD-dependent oxidoreductase [Lactobacillus sp. HT06-2]